MQILQAVLLVVLAITSILLTLLILLHKGRGGGLSDMFGGGVTSSLGASGVAERNLNRITVVLGLVTTKFGEMEDKDELKRRIDDAAKYAPMEQLALSPQCGFSSTVHGNNIAVEAQRAKLRLVIETAQEVWGS